MPLKLVQRGKSANWYIRGTIRGIVVDESTGLADKKLAEEALIVRSAELVRESIHGHTAVRTFADAALSYLEAGGDGEHLMPILEHFGPRKLLSAIDQGAIDEAARKIKPNGGPATRNRQVFTPISAVLHHAARKKWCAAPVIARPKQSAGRVRWITYDEADRLILGASPHLRPLIIFLLCTGARISEALYLDWSQVDLDRAHVSILNEDAGGVAGTKNDESRGVPLHPRAVAALSALPHRHGPVFRAPIKGKKAKNPTREERLYGAPYERRVDANGKVTGGGMIKTAWGTACKAAGLVNFTPHDTRHTWATWHYRQHRDLAALMQLGGWKSVEMVLRYAHVNTDHLAGSIAQIWGVSGEGDAVAALKALPAKA